MRSNCWLSDWLVIEFALLDEQLEIATDLIVNNVTIKDEYVMRSSAER